MASSPLDLQAADAPARVAVAAPGAETNLGSAPRAHDGVREISANEEVGIRVLHLDEPRAYLFWDTGAVRDAALVALDLAQQRPLWQISFGRRAVRHWRVAEGRLLIQSYGAAPDRLQVIRLDDGAVEHDTELTYRSAVELRPLVVAGHWLLPTGDLVSLATGEIVGGVATPADDAVAAADQLLLAQTPQLGRLSLRLVSVPAGQSQAAFELPIDTPHSTDELGRARCLAFRTPLLWRYVLRFSGAAADLTCWNVDTNEAVWRRELPPAPLRLSFADGSAEEFDPHAGHATWEQPRRCLDPLTVSAETGDIQSPAAPPWWTPLLWHMEFDQPLRFAARNERYLIGDLGHRRLICLDAQSRQFLWELSGSAASITPILNDAPWIGDYLLVGLVGRQGLPQHLQAIHLPSRTQQTYRLQALGLERQSSSMPMPEDLVSPAAPATRARSDAASDQATVVLVAAGVFALWTLWAMWRRTTRS